MDSRISMINQRASIDFHIPDYLPVFDSYLAPVARCQYVQVFLDRSPNEIPLPLNFPPALEPQTSQPHTAWGCYHNLHRLQSKRFAAHYPLARAEQHSVCPQRLPSELDATRSGGQALRSSTFHRRGGDLLAISESRGADRRRSSLDRARRP